MNRHAFAGCLLLLLSAASSQAGDGDWSGLLKSCKKATDRGHYREAESHAAAALQKATQSGAGDKVIARCLIQQAEVLLKQGRYGKVNEIAGRAQVLLEKLHGPEHPDVALCLELRADALCAMGFPTVAFKLARQSAILRRKAFGDQHLELARALETLNRIYATPTENSWALGWKEPEEWFARAGERVLAIRQALLGENHPGLIPALLSRTGSDQEREARLRQAEKLIRKHYSEEHPLMAECLRELARVELDRKNVQAAETGLQRSLALSRKTLGSDHPGAAATLELLSQVSRRRGHSIRAETLLLESIRCRFRGLSDAELCWFFQIAVRLRHTSDPFQKDPLSYEVYLTEMIARRGPTIESCLQRYYDELSSRYGRAVLFNHFRDFLADLRFASLQDLPYAHDDFESLEVLTALRRVQGRPDPVQIVVRRPTVLESVFPDLPEFAVALRNVDSLSQPAGFTEGGDYRSGRLTRWRFQVQDSRGEILPIRPPADPHDGGIFGRTSLRRGEEWATTLPLGHYTLIPRPGDYSVRILYHDRQPLMSRTLLAGLIVCQSPVIQLKVSPRVIEVSAEERTRVKQLLKTLDPKGKVLVVADGYGPWAHEFVAPTSPPGQILTLGWKAVPVLFDELARTDLPDKQRAWILALLFSITGANDPRDDTSGVLGDHVSHQRPWTVSFGRPGQTSSGGFGWSEPISTEETIDPRKQKAFAQVGGMEEVRRGQANRVNETLIPRKGAEMENKVSSLTQRRRSVSAPGVILAIRAPWKRRVLALVSLLLSLWGLTEWMQSLALSTPQAAEGRDAGSRDGLAPDSTVRLRSDCFQQEGGIAGLAFSPDGRTLISCSFPGEVCKWDVRTAKLLERWKGVPELSNFVRFASDGKMVAGASEGWIYCLDLARKRVVRQLGPCGDHVTGMAFSPDGRRLAACAFREIACWDMESGRLLFRRKTPDLNVNCVGFSPDGELLLAGGDVFSIEAVKKGIGNVWFFRVSTGTWLKHLSSVWDTRCLCYSPDGKLLATCGDDTKVLLYNTETDRLLYKFEGCAIISRRGNVVWQVVFSPDGRFLASQAQDRTVRIWSLESKQQTALIRGRDVWAMRLAFSPDGRVLAIGMEGGQIRLHEVPSGRKL